MKLTLACTLLIASLVNARPFMDEQEMVAPLYIPPTVETVQDSYIVILKDHLEVEDIEQHAEWIQTLTQQNQKDRLFEWLNPHTSSHGIAHVYDTPHVKGYSGRFDEAILDAIRQSNDVIYYYCYYYKLFMHLFVRSNMSKRIHWCLQTNYNVMPPGVLLEYHTRNA